MTRASVSTLSVAAFLWALTLSASPQLHQRVHPDANQVEHTCAVTLIASGNCDHASTALLISVPVLLGEFEISELTLRWVQPVFLVAAVFERGPPA